MKDNKIRHSKDDSLTDLQFERLYNASFNLEPKEDIESRIVLMLAGRLGLRRGEISHIQKNWIDWRKRRINIPRFYDCDLGRDNRSCGSCRQHAKQIEKYNEEINFEEAISIMWRPKTEMAVRAIPFDFSPRTEIIIEKYFSEWDRWMYSAQVINRRITKLSEEAEIKMNVYPHSLRATAASFLAGRGMSTLTLQSMFGWAEPSTARNYVAQNADRTSRELHLING